MLFRVVQTQKKEVRGEKVNNRNLGTEPKPKTIRLAPR
jgi:hypothetical protein